MGNSEQVCCANNGVVPIDGQNYLEVTARVYADEHGQLPPAGEAAVTVVKALGSLAGSGQSVMADTQPVTMQPVEGGWLKSPWAGFNLNERRVTLACGIALGRTNEELAKDLFLSPLTVKSLVSNLMNSTGTKKRSGIPPVLWRLVVPDLLDHSTLPQRPTHRFGAR